jgi:hypothetical protein
MMYVARFRKRCVTCGRSGLPANERSGNAPSMRRNG